MLLVDGACRLFEGRDLATLPPALDERVAAFPCELAVAPGELSRFGKRDEGRRPETDIAAPCADDRPQDPATRAGVVDEKVKSVCR